jgi:hypothetical protein
MYAFAASFWILAGLVMGEIDPSAIEGAIPPIDITPTTATKANHGATRAHESFI